MTESDTAGPFTHLDPSGAARMVDVTERVPTVRSATARLRRATFSPSHAWPVSRRQSAHLSLSPLAHVIGLHGAAVELEVTDDGVAIEATVRTADRTGVEMEALTAASVAALAVIDMVKGLDKSVSIERIELLRKTGGKSGGCRAARSTRCLDAEPDRRRPHTSRRRSCRASADLDTWPAIDDYRSRWKDSHA